MIIILYIIICLYLTYYILIYVTYGTICDMIYRDKRYISQFDNFGKIHKTICVLAWLMVILQLLIYGIY